MMRSFNIYLTSALVLAGFMLQASCNSELKITTNAADIDCSLLTEDAYCIKVRNGQINSVKDLALVQDKILTRESGFNLNWKLPETAKGILATKIMLTSDAGCTQELESAVIDSKEQVYSFTDIKDGIYYGCVFAKARAAGLVGAKNNGIKIVVETARPKIEWRSDAFYSNGRPLDQGLNIRSLSAVSSEWTQTSGPGELTFINNGSAVPTITASTDGNYTFTITAINEVGGKATKTFTLIYDSTPPVLKDIAPILSSASSIAIHAESDEDLQIYRWEIIRTPAGIKPELKDANSATAELSLPSLGIYELRVSVTDQAGNVSSTKVLVTKQTPAAPPADTTNPSAPSAITVAPYSNTTSLSASYTAGSDANFSTHNAKACTNNDCMTGCQSATQDVASPVTVSSLVHGNSYWICLQSIDQANNVSAYVASGNSVTIDTTNPTAPASPTFASTYTNSTTAAISWTHGTDSNFSTHNIMGCSNSDCATSCTPASEASASPGSLTGLANDTSYYACVQSLDLATNTSAWIPSAGTITIDTSSPGLPTAVTFSNTFQISFTAGTETNPSSFNLKACTDAGCSAGCVGDTTTAASPGQISAGALTINTAYYGCVQATDLATNASAFVASGATSTRYPYSISYHDNGSGGGSVPHDARTYNSGHTVTVLANTGSLVKTGYNFHSWNTQANGSGTSYTSGQTFVMGSANVTLYAQWIVDCSGLAGGTWVAVPGSTIYGTDSFCVMKYPAGNVSSVATSQPGTNPWVSINQVDARSACAALGAGFHLTKNPEWMTIASDIANTNNNWSGGTVGSGTLRRGHSDNSPGSLCGADASDANAYVEGSCTGSSTGTFLQRRTSSLSNGQVIWDIGGNVWSWVDYNSPWDKAYSGGGWVEFPALTYSATMPRTLMVPVNSVQTWWSDTWNSSQGIGQYIESGTNGAGGAMIRGNSWFAHQYAGSFSLHVWNDQWLTAHDVSFRCAYTPFRLTYHGNGHTSGSVPTDNNSIYSGGDSTTASANSGNLARVGYTFAGWNTAYNGTGTNYAPGDTLNFTAGSITLYAKWTLDCSGLAGGTWVVAPGDGVYGTRDFCVMKYAATNVGSVATSGTTHPPWVNISQTDAITACSNLGSNYHLISNPEWMTIGANIANNGSNWSGGSVGNGTLSSGHSDNSPGSACPADATDANSYVEGSCAGSSTGTFNQRRTGLLSNGAMIWDFGGNVWNWVNYNNLGDKPTPAAMSWYEFNSLTFTATTPRAHLLPVNSAQNWWSDSWNSSQRIGQFIAGSNGGGGALRRGGGWDYNALSGPFTAGLLAWPSYSEWNIGFRCAHQPAAARSCRDHLNNGASTNGIYTIDPDGTGPVVPFSAYCDMTTDGGGWTLMASSYPPNTGLNKVSTLTSPTAAGILVEEKLVAIANVATTVRMSGEGKKVISFDNWPIWRMRNMQMLVDPWNGFGWAHFNGNNDPELFHYSWSPGDHWRFDGLNLHNTIFNASYNGDGLHWNTSVAKWRWNHPNAVYNLNLWVK